MCVVLSFPFDYPFIAYFLKTNYSLRQNTLKNLRVWERSLTSVPISVYLCLIEVGTWLGTGSAKEPWRIAEKMATGRCTELWILASGQFTGGKPTTMEWSDSAIQCPVRWWFSVWSSEGNQGVWTGLWLRPVGVHQKRPVATPEVLDLSGVDQTLGGSVRSLPPERPVSRNHSGFQLLSCFLFYFIGATI